jgi:hypothetical protein
MTIMGVASDIMYRYLIVTLVIPIIVGNRMPFKIAAKVSSPKNYHIKKNIRSAILCKLTPFRTRNSLSTQIP